MKLRKGKSTLAVIVIVALIAVFGWAYTLYGPKAQEGTKNYSLEVVDAEGVVTSYEGKTDAEFLRGLMDELAAEGEFSYDGSESEYGLYIETVNGVTADYNADGAYWSIYVNGEYGQYGADSQPVADGDEYQLVYEVYQP